MAAILDVRSNEKTTTKKLDSWPTKRFGWNALVIFFIEYSILIIGYLMSKKIKKFEKIL
jgi:hypothetical protein